MSKVEKFTLFYIDMVFLAVSAFAAFAGNLPAIPDALFIVILGLAAYRGGKALSENLIFKWIRDWLGVLEEADSSGAGNSNNPDPKKRGVRYVLAELICCPICASTWAGVVLLALYSVVPDLGRVLLYALSGAGLAEVLVWLSEYLSWGGRASREVSGSYWLEKNGKAIENGKIVEGRFRSDYIVSQIMRDLEKANKRGRIQ